MGNGDMNFKKPIFVLLGTIAITLSTCTRREEQLSVDENVKVDSEHIQAVDFEELVSDLLSLQDSVKMQPDEVVLREKLLARSTDASREVLRAVGRGKPPANVASPVMARQFAERAAYLDGCRWLAYLMEWKKNSSSPGFGEIEAQLPGSRVLYKSELVDSTLTVLVETDIAF
jgi:hypothetical protein